MIKKRKNRKPFWNKKYGKNSICAITHTRLRPGRNKQGQTYVLKVKCGHIFYRSAINIWLENHDTCPCCRQTIT